MSSSNPNPIQVVVAGALGRMGVEVIKTIFRTPGYDLIAAIDTNPEKQGIDIGSELGLGSLELFVTNDFEASICAASQATRNNGPNSGAVLIDFTHPSVAYEHTRTAIAYGVHPVIGTTGFTSKDIDELETFAEKASVGSAIIPNFSIGMVLLQQAAKTAASFYDFAELTELHHNLKADAPSGTCIKTAEMIETNQKPFNQTDIDEKELIDGSRGGLRESGLRIHSVRLPGLVAHQEVIFGALGETYKLRHDTIDRRAYMPGILLTVSKVRSIPGLVYGLEHLI